MNKKKITALLLVAVLLGTSACGKTAKKAETKKSEEKKDGKLTISNVDLNDPNLNEKWKKEPRYGTKLILAYNGGLCTSALGVAQAKGFTAKQGLDVEVKNVPNAMDAIGTGKVDANTDHISTSVVPAVNGVNAVFTRAAQTGCKSLYVLKDSSINCYT